MIDLRHPLPTGIEVGGVFYALNTDFRIWIEFTRAASENDVALRSIFKNQQPEGNDWVPAAMEFAASENETPAKGKAKSSRIILDLIRDGDYIVGAFMQAYGIDLTTAHMHWHLFLALLRSLPKDCKLCEIMGYRSFTKNDLKQKPEQQYADLQKAWYLPPKPDAAIMEWQEWAFGNLGNAPD